VGSSVTRPLFDVFFARSVGRLVGRSLGRRIGYIHSQQPKPPFFRFDVEQQLRSVRGPGTGIAFMSWLIGNHLDSYASRTGGHLTHPDGRCIDRACKVLTLT